MSNTTKYVLIGGAALVATYLIARRLQAQQAATSKPSGLASVIGGVKDVYDGYKAGGFSYRTAGTNDGTLPYGPGASDGGAAVSDATGLRQLHALVPAQETYMTSAQRNLAGIYS